jgi:hypothetical protein
MPGAKWSKAFGGAQDTFGQDVALDPSGNVIAVGYFDGDVDLGAGKVMTSGFQDYDGFVVKLDAAGSHLWSKTFGDTKAQQAYAVAAGADGSVAVGGAFDGTIDLGKGGLSAVGTDPFFALYDGAGVLQWVRTPLNSTLGAAYGLDVARDAAGAVYGCGITTKPLDLGGGSLPSFGGLDSFVVKYDAAGVHKWSKSFGDAGNQGACKIAVDGSGNLLVAFRHTGTVEYGSGTPVTSAGLGDVLLVRFAGATGAYQTKLGPYGDAGDSFPGTLIAAGSHALVAGWFEGSINFGGGALASAGGKDIFLARLDLASAGAPVFAKRLGGTLDDRALGVGLGAGGEHLVAGHFQGSFDPGKGTIVSGGDADVFLARYDAMALPLAQHGPFGGTGQQLVSEAAADGKGRIVVIGQFQSGINFGLGAHTSAASYDMFLVAFEP